MEELIAQQAELIARLLLEIGDAKAAAVAAGADPNGASLVDLVRQLVHDISQAHQAAEEWEKQATDAESEVDRLQREIEALEAAQNRALDEERAAIEDATEDLCMALGYARRPIKPTGLRELDALVAAVF